MDRGSEVRIRGPEQNLGSRARQGAETGRCSSGEVHCHFIAPAPPVSTKCCPRCTLRYVYNYSYIARTGCEKDNLQLGETLRSQKLLGVAEMMDGVEVGVAEMMPADK